ncbi:MAG: restriction endonuclease subunit S [Leptolyngbya sp.]|nr:restriction endonuclease subunit S [Leptolyngbya sp.]
MTATVKLGEIANIRYGITMRGAVKPLSEKELQKVKNPIGLVQMRDLTEYNELDSEDVYYIQDDELNPNHLLKSGDILFRSRGVTNTAVHLGNIPENFVASSPLTVIRVKSTKADPAYVAWYINHTEGQRQIKRFAMGTSLLSISIADLRQMKVHLPPLETQRQIVELVALAQQEQVLMARMAEKRSQYLRAVLGNCIQN